MNKTQVLELVTVTRAMVKAGVRVLRESGFLSFESSADELVVRDILVTALACRKATKRKESVQRNGSDRPATDSDGALGCLIESIDRLAFFARHRAADAPLSPCYAEAYVSVLRKRLADVTKAITNLSAAQ